MHRESALVLFLALCFTAPGMHADAILLDATATGELSETQVCGRPGCFITGYSYRNPLQDMSLHIVQSIGQSTGVRGLAYLIFDLGSLAFTARGAALELGLQYAQGLDPGLTVTTLDSTITAQLAAVAPGVTHISPANLGNMTPEELAAMTTAYARFQAIESGDSLGTLSATGPLDDIFRIPLNDAALDQINAAGGLWGVGLNWTPTLQGTFFNLGDMLAFDGTFRLSLSDTAIPLPSTLPLVLLALAVLLGSAKGLARTAVDMVA